MNRKLFCFPADGPLFVTFVCLFVLFWVTLWKYISMLLTTTHQVIDWQSRCDVDLMYCKPTLHRSPTILGGGAGQGYSVNLLVGVCRRDSERLNLFQTLFSCILQPYSRLETKIPYPIPDPPSVTPQFPDKWHHTLDQILWFPIPD